MNKKLIVAAIAAIVAAPSAFAESTVYGKLHTSLDKQDYEGVADNWALNTRSSRIGLKGSEDLGGGLKAIYQFETTISSTGDSGPFGSQRNTFVGLAGGFGTFVVGRHDTPAKMAFYAAGNERLGDSVIDLNGGSQNPIGVFTERRVNDAIAYVSPNFSGVTVAAAVIPGEDTGLVGGGPNDGLADHYSLGVMYSGNGLKAGLGYEKLSDVVAVVGGTDDDTMWQAGASYTMNMFSVGAQYEDREIGTTDYKAWALTAKATMGNNAVSVVYTDSETDPSGVASTDTQGWGLSAQHNFSKRTTAYVAYAQNENDLGATTIDDDAFSIGMIHNF